MKLIDEEDYIVFAKYKDLSYIDNDDDNVELYVSDKLEGEIKVFIDSEKKDMGIPEKKCEYICLNHEIVYLDNITKK